VSRQKQLGKALIIAQLTSLTEITQKL